MIKGFAHVCLSATDLAATERFYCKGLGCIKAFDFIKDNRIIGFYLEISKGSYIEVFLRDEVESEAKSPISHFCLEVDDITQISRQLKENGYDTTDKKLGADQSWQIWTTDPDGTRIEFHEYTGSSSQITRKNCILH